MQRRPPLRSIATLGARSPPGVVRSVQLIVESITVERGSRAVIDSLSLVVRGGEALVLVGANGAGKTTLLRTLAGFLTPAGGTFRLEGGDPEKTLAEQSHVVGHAYAVKPALTVAENVDFWAAYLDDAGQPPPRASRALEHFGLSALAGFPAGYLSAGQKRRLGLARLLVCDRPVWLLDEPTASLDTASAKMLADAVNAHTNAGGIVIAATHLPLGLERSRELRLDARELLA